MTAKKGQGAYTANQLDARQKYIVIKWVESHKAGTLEGRAKQASADCGFPVTLSTIATWHHAIYGPVREFKPKPEPKPESRPSIDVAALVKAITEQVMAAVSK